VRGKRTRGIGVRLLLRMKEKTKKKIEKKVVKE
jgi:hypothetical protein